MLPEGDGHPHFFRLFNDDEVGDTADDQQVAGKGAGQGQHVPLVRLVRIEKMDEQHDRRHVAHQVAQYRGNGRQVDRGGQVKAPAGDGLDEQGGDPGRGHGLHHDEQGAEQGDEMPVDQLHHLPGAHAPAAEQDAGHGNGRQFPGDVGEKEHEQHRDGDEPL